MTKHESSLLMFSLLGIDALLIVLNVFPTGNSGIDEFFNLDLESNFVTWYSSAKLFSAALLCWLLSQEITGYKWSLIALSLAFIGISMSESAMFHERLSGAMHTMRTGEVWYGGGHGMWVVYLSPFVAAVLVAIARACIVLSRISRRARWWFAVGLLLWIVVLLAETSPSWAGISDNKALRWEAIFEESAELLGASSFVVGLTLLRTNLDHSQ